MGASKPTMQRASDREFHNIRELLEMLMSELSPTKQKMPVRPNLGWTPPTDVYETEKEFVVTVDIAGMERDHISVDIEGNVLWIRGVRGETAPAGKKQFHKLEIQVGPFQRTIQIPSDVDTDTMRIDYAGGMLEIRIKKTQIKRREIEIE